MSSAQHPLSSLYTGWSIGFHQTDYDNPQLILQSLLRCVVCPIFSNRLQRSLWYRHFGRLPRFAHSPSPARMLIESLSMFFLGKGTSFKWNDWNDHYFFHHPNKGLLLVIDSHGIILWLWQFVCNLFWWMQIAAEVCRKWPNHILVWENEEIWINCFFPMFVAMSMFIDWRVYRLGSLSPQFMLIPIIIAYILAYITHKTITASSYQPISFISSMKII